MRALARVLRRPYWLTIPGFVLRLVLGEMSDLVLEGRYSQPKHLLDQGFRFDFPTLELALKEMFATGDPASGTA
jgi:NAD dependent epimerase/dehydratase family enzyme